MRRAKFLGGILAEHERFAVQCGRKTRRHSRRRIKLAFSLRNVFAKRWRNLIDLAMAPPVDEASEVLVFPSGEKPRRAVLFRYLFATEEKYLCQSDGGMISGAVECESPDVRRRAPCPDLETTLADRHERAPASASRGAGRQE
jgi:hypothetical protein